MSVLTQLVQKSLGGLLLRGVLAAGLEDAALLEAHLPAARSPNDRDDVVRVATIDPLDRERVATAVTVSARELVRLTKIHRGNGSGRMKPLRRSHSTVVASTSPSSPASISNCIPPPG